MTTRRLLIDGMNVIGSRPTGWWRDRDGAVRSLVTRLQGLAAEGAPVTVVFDGRPPAGLEEGRHDGVDVRYARRRGRDAADDRIVSLCRTSREPLRVVTSDRNLRQRVEALGVPVDGASALLRRLDDLGS